MGAVMGKNTDITQIYCISWLPSNLKSPGDCSRLQTRCSKRLGNPEFKALNYEAPHAQNRIQKYIIILIKFLWKTRLQGTQF